VGCYHAVGEPARGEEKLAGDDVLAGARCRRDSDVAAVRAPDQIDAAERAGEVETGGTGETQVFAGGVPGLEVALGDRAAERGPRDSAQSGRLAGGEYLFLRRRHHVPPESRARPGS
jgi:hypothetical protein